MQPKYKEKYIIYISKLRSKIVYFSIKRFSRSIRTSNIKVIDNISVIVLHSLDNKFKNLQLSLSTLLYK